MAHEPDAVLNKTIHAVEFVPDSEIQMLKCKLPTGLVLVTNETQGQDSDRLTIICDVTAVRVDGRTKVWIKMRWELVKVGHSFIPDKKKRKPRKRDEMAERSSFFDCRNDIDQLIRRSASQEISFLPTQWLPSGTMCSFGRRRCHGAIGIGQTRPPRQRAELTCRDDVCRLSGANARRLLPFAICHTADSGAGFAKIACGLTRVHNVGGASPTGVTCAGWEQAPDIGVKSHSELSLLLSRNPRYLYTDKEIVHLRRSNFVALHP